MTERRGGLVIDNCGNCPNVNNPQGCTDKKCYEIMKNRLAELEDKIENGTLVPKYSVVKSCNTYCVCSVDTENLLVIDKYETKAEALKKLEELKRT